MKIYVAHSREYDFINELYLPIRNHEEFDQHEIILPHESSNTSSNTREFYKNIDFMIAECSYPSIGLGIELGWAFDDNIPIYCIHKQSMKISGSVYTVTQNIYDYSNSEELLNVIKNILTSEQTKKEEKQKTKKFNNTDLTR